MYSPRASSIAAIVAVSISAFSPAAGAAGADEKQRDSVVSRARLQGTWLLTHETDHGRKLDDQLQSRFTLVIEKDRWTLIEEGGDADKTWIVTLDPSLEPGRTCQFGDDKGKVSQAIYELKGERLRLCIADPGERRPPKFDGQGNQTLLVLERGPSPHK